jgi:hypothetical protein
VSPIPASTASNSHSERPASSVVADKYSDTAAGHQQLADGSNSGWQRQAQASSIPAAASCIESEVVLAAIVSLLVVIVLVRSLRTWALCSLVVADTTTRGCLVDMLDAAAVVCLAAGNAGCSLTYWLPSFASASSTESFARVETQSLVQQELY